MDASTIPETGQLVTVRDRQWVVADAMGDELEVIWELEPGPAIVDYGALPIPARVSAVRTAREGCA